MEAKFLYVREGNCKHKGEKVRFNPVILNEKNHHVLTVFNT